MELNYKELVWDSDSMDYFDPKTGKHVKELQGECKEDTVDFTSENSEVVDEIIESVRNGEWL